jgi:hypothetical protein
MEFIISNDEIRNTKAFENYFKILVLNYLTKKKVISSGPSYRNNGVIPGSIGGNNLKVLKELIDNEKRAKL